MYTNNQEFECTRQSETLTTYADDSRINVKLGRALKKGEFRVKVYQLLLGQSDVSIHTYMYEGCILIPRNFIEEDRVFT